LPLASAADKPLLTKKAPKGAFFTIKKGRKMPTIKVAVIHLFFSVLVALVLGLLVFVFWYPTDYRGMSAGLEIFLVIVAVDVVCGPMLTLIVYKKNKSMKVLAVDLSLIFVLQLGALIYGVGTVWNARPLFLIHEIDRFKLISKLDIAENHSSNYVKKYSPGIFEGPVHLGLREPTVDERKQIMFESALGGKDYAERPEFYVPYSSELAQAAWSRAKPLTELLYKKPDLAGSALQTLSQTNLNVNDVRYVPIVAPQDSIAILNKNGEVVGYLQGDGF
jgi:hypothetical protein